MRTRIGGRVVTRTFTKVKDRDNYANSIETDKLRGVAIDPRRARVTVHEYGEKWLKARHDLAQSTHELYWHLFRAHIVPELGPTPIGTLTVTQVRSWHSTLRRQHPTTAAKSYRLLATMMKAAVEDDLLARSPCRVKGAATETSPERPVASIAEVDELAAAMPDDQRVAVLLAAWCQMRHGEVLGLRRGDVDLMHGMVTVATTKVRTMDGKVVTKEPKTAAGRRSVAIPSNIVPELERHLAEHVGPEPDALLLPKGSKPLRTAWDRARTTVGVRYTFHDLRHSGLTWCGGDRGDGRRTDAPGRTQERHSCDALPTRHSRPGPGLGGRLGVLRGASGHREDGQRTRLARWTRDGGRDWDDASSLSWGVSPSQTGCRRGDLNPHALAGTSPSSWRVCLFRHSDELAMGKQRSEIVARGHRPTSGPERAPTRADAGLTQPARSPHTTLT